MSREDDGGDLTEDDSKRRKRSDDNDRDLSNRNGEGRSRNESEDDAEVRLMKMMMVIEKKQGTWELGGCDNGEGDSFKNRGELVGDRTDEGCVLEEIN